MSERERWIVYPLLFLSLGISLRSKIVPEVRFERVVCKELVSKIAEVEDLECEVLSVTDDGATRMRFGTATSTVEGKQIPQRAGRAELYGRDGKTVIVLGADLQGETGIIDTFNASGNPLVQLASTARGGTVTTFDNELMLPMTFGHDPRWSGVFALIAKTGQIWKVPFLAEVTPTPTDGTQAVEPTKPEEKTDSRKTDESKSAEEAASTEK